MDKSPRTRFLIWSVGGTLATAGLAAVPAAPNNTTTVSNTTSTRPPQPPPPPPRAAAQPAAPAVSSDAPPVQQLPPRRIRHRHEGQAPRAGGRLGDPLGELTATQLADFTTGLGEFENVETLDGGLGPIFNNTSCAICHSVPATGGSSATLVTRFGKNIQGHFDPLTALGGSLLNEKSLDPGCLEVVPPEATVIAHRQSTPLFGLGLIEAIPDETIQQLARTRRPDGVAGRAALIEDVTTGETRVGRFGWKAQQATLLAFAADAYLNEMGVTNRFFPEENAPNGDTIKLAQYDRVLDPEDVVDPLTKKGDIDIVADYMRLLAPPPTPRVTGGLQVGLALFDKTGCAVCHVPTLFTGASKIRALDRKPVNLFSDLLLHDMGELNDGIAQADALPKEMKTAPLWGLKVSAPYLHDGRAPTLPDAIRAHDGEGAAARDRFNKLTTSQQRQLVDFLNTL